MSDPSPNAAALKGVDPVRKSLPLASVLPREAYVSNSWYQLELEQLFAKCWIWVGRESQLAAVGDFFTVNVGQDPVLIVRPNNKKITALMNVCRHRGSIVVPKPFGNSKAFTCPYHGWTYGLDGALAGTPGLDWKDMEGVLEFDTKKFGLHEIRAETWQGLIFINFDEDAESLKSYLGNVPEILVKWQLNRLVTSKTVDRKLNVNWKIFADNMTEQYHIPYVHNETLHRDVRIDSIKGDGNWLVISDSTKSTFSHSGVNDEIPTIPGTENGDLNHDWFMFLYPCSFFSASPFVFSAFNVIPDSISRCSLNMQVMFPNPTLTPLKYMQEVYEYKEKILFQEDTPMQESVQRGLSSQHGFRAGDGRLSVKYENGLYHFHNWLLDRVSPKNELLSKDLNSQKYQDG